MNEKIAEYIETLAQQLGVAVTHLYEVMARQQIAEGIAYGLLCLVIVVVVPIIVYKMARLTFRKWSEIYEEDGEFIIMVAWLFGGIGSAVVFVISLLSLPEYVMHVINPEYYVVKEILEVFK